MKIKLFTQNELFYYCSIFFLTTSFLICTQQAHSQVPTYNVLFIAIDDMGDRCSFLGNSEVVTPNLQRLVARGMVFTHAYCQYSLCNPSRTSLLSGWRPDKTQIFNNNVRPSSVLEPDVLYLPEYFKQSSYHIERYGKIMHGFFENDISWDYAEPDERSEPDGITSALVADSTSGSAIQWWIDNVPDSTIKDGVEARHLVDRMKKTQTQPFFYALGFHSPHAPFTPNLYYWNMIGDSAVKEFLPVDKKGTLTNLKGNGSGPIILPSTPLNDRGDEPEIAFHGDPLFTTNGEWKKAIHAYDAEVSQMDAQLGLILDEMGRQNLWENTIVILWSDHGQHLGEHEGQWGKVTLFEESLHVPLIVCVPGKPAGKCSRLVELVDLYPTLAELCKLPAPPNIEGASFAPLLDNPNLTWKRAVFSQLKKNNESYKIMGRTIRTEQFRYTSWDTAGEELYNHTTDPHEYTNLATNTQYSSVLNQMKTILAEGWKNSLPPCTFTASMLPNGIINLCNGDSVILTANRGTRFQWFKNGEPVKGAIFKTFKAKDIGNYRVQESNGFGCVSTSTITTINLLPKPKAEITALSSIDICQTDSVILSANNGTNLSYQWIKNGINIPGATKRRYVATSTGNYRVIVTDSNGCSKISKRVTVTNLCDKVAAATNSSNKSLLSSETISLYPNPVRSNVTITYNSVMANIIQLKIYNATGRLVNSNSEKTVKGKNIYHINLSNTVAGVYFLELNNSKEKNIKRFIVAK